MVLLPFLMFIKIPEVVPDEVLKILLWGEPDSECED
jgi:hypothetical protein